jgi:hypothetical protein
MSVEGDAPRTTDEEYIRRVLQRKPSALIPWIARVAAQYADIGSWLHGDYMGFTPWALADIARVSLVLGSGFRHRATRNDLLLYAEAHRNLADPELGSNNPGG